MTATLDAPAGGSGATRCVSEHLFPSPEESTVLGDAVLRQIEMARSRGYRVLSAMTHPYPLVALTERHEHPSKAPCLTCALYFDPPSRTAVELVRNSLSLRQVDERWNDARPATTVLRKLRLFTVEGADLAKQFGPDWARILGWAMELTAADRATVYALAGQVRHVPAPTLLRPELEWLLGIVLRDVCSPDGRSPAQVSHTLRAAIIPPLVAYVASQTVAPSTVRARAHA